MCGHYGASIRETVDGVRMTCDPMLCMFEKLLHLGADISAVDSGGSCVLAAGPSLLV